MGLDQLTFQLLNEADAKEWGKSNVVPQKLLQEANRAWEAYSKDSGRSRPVQQGIDCVCWSGRVLTRPR